jgi:hypothetical protein
VLEEDLVDLQVEHPVAVEGTLDGGELGGVGRVGVVVAVLGADVGAVEVDLEAGARLPD